MKTLFQKIFGRRYYANIILVVGTDRFEICNRIFSERKQAEHHRETIERTTSYKWVATVSFRSRAAFTD